VGATGRLKPRLLARAATPRALSLRACKAAQLPTVFDTTTYRFRAAEQYTAQSLVSVRRFSNRSPRRYAVSGLSIAPLPCALPPRGRRQVICRGRAKTRKH